MIVGVEQLLADIAECLEAPRNRFGRIEVPLNSEAGERIRKLAIHYGVDGGQDKPDQIAKVIRAILKED